MSIDWKLGLTPIGRLTLENFPDFARDYAKYTYALCYKASLDVKQAATLTASTLAAVICKEASKEGSENLMPDDAIKLVLLDQLNKQQLTRLNDDSIQTDRQPNEELVDAIVKRATDIAQANMPRYARVFSGVKGTLVILGLVAALLAAVVLVWLNPSACNSVAHHVGSGKTGGVEATARPDTDMLINVLFDDSAAEVINSGACPVIFTVDGPDSRTVTGVSVFDSAGTPYEAYPCGEYTYCFITEQGDVFRTLISSEMGEMSSYCIVPPIESDANAPIQKYYAVSHNDTVWVALAFDETVTVQPARGTFQDGIGGMTYTPIDGEEGIGLDMFSYTTSDGTVYTVPILVSNSSPFIDPDSLRSSATHTPSRSGMTAGRIVSSDADGDKLTFTMTGSVGCSAMISSDGSYIALIENGYRAEEASFSFTVSDGIITSDPYTVRIALENNLIEATEISASFICYSGEDGYYSLELPAADDDGDSLTWNLVTETNNGLTAQWNSEINVENGNICRYRIDPSINQDFVEVLTFSCSDGWKSGSLLTVICSNAANAAPRSSGNNYAVITGDQQPNVLEVSIIDDCQFDKCAIISVDEVRGGTVSGNTGWSDLKFTFTPDGTEEYCSVLLTVADICSGMSVQIVYDIVIE